MLDASYYEILTHNLLERFYNGPFHSLTRLVQMTALLHMDMRLKNKLPNVTTEKMMQRTQLIVTFTATRQPETILHVFMRFYLF